MSASARAARAGPWLCLGGAALGALGLFGWVTGTSLLTTLIPSQPPMMPSTALGVLLVGVAGALRHRVSAGRLRYSLSVLAAIVVLSIGVGTFVEYASVVDLRIDQWLERILASPSPARPALPAALVLTLLGAAILLLDVRPTAGVRPSEWLILSAVVTAFAAFAGFIVGAAPLYRMSREPVIGMALPSAVGLLLTSAGLLFIRPSAGVMGIATSPGPGGIQLRRLALPTLVTPLLLGFVVTRFATAHPIGVGILASALAMLGLLVLAITARPLNRFHEALESSRIRTLMLLEQAPVGIFVADLDGRLIEVNRTGCRLLQYAREELIGKTIFDLIPPGEADRLWRERASLLAGAIQTSEWRLRRSDGSYALVEVSASILPDGRWQGVARDITERKRIENQHRILSNVGEVLAATTLDLDETLTNTAEVAVQELADVCIVDLAEDDGKVRRVRVVSRDPSMAWACDALATLPADRWRPGRVRSALEARSFVLMSQLSTEDVDALSQSDVHRQVFEAIGVQSAMAVPLVTHGKLLGAIVLIAVTPSRAYDAHDMLVARELADRAALVVEGALLYNAATRAIQTRDEVLGVVAHDLRGPLGIVLMQAALLRQKEGDGERRKPLEAIERASRRMNLLSQDLLDVTRVEAGQLRLERKLVLPSQIVSSAVEIQQPVASSASLELRLDLAPDIPDVWGDPDRLLQVLENLIGNALKFTPTGTITVGAAARDMDALFWVSDTGPGIAADDQPHLFDRFWQARKSGAGGAGLGLAIVKGIVEAHGGRIWVDSAPGRGSTFYFTIPTARSQGAERSAPAVHGRGSREHDERRAS